MEKSKLMAEIMLLAMMVQEKTNHAVFVRFSGHVERIEINIVRSKKDWTTKVAESNFYTNKKNSLERMERAKQTLLEILEAEKVDTSGMDYRIEEIYHYIF